MIDDSQMRLLRERFPRPYETDVEQWVSVKGHGVPPEAKEEHEGGEKEVLLHAMEGTLWDGVPYKGPGGVEEIQAARTRAIHQSKPTAAHGANIFYGKVKE